VGGTALRKVFPVNAGDAAAERGELLLDILHLFRFFFAHYNRYAGEIKTARIPLFFSALALVLIASRLCHAGILWEGDALPLATARQILFGKVMYREVWNDKPPLVALFHLLVGARDGWPLRTLDALYAWLVCWLAYASGRAVWSQREGLWAAALAGFFLIFDFPATAIPAASDLLLVAPHLAAVWLAWKRRPLWCGIAIGIAFWVSPKALFVLPVCALFDIGGALWMLAGLGAVVGLGAACLWMAGALGAYWTEVWEWGSAYAASPFVADPLWNGVARTANWLGFHAAAVIAAMVFLWKTPAQRWKWMAWIALSLAGISAGMRFFPRYYYLLLPPLVIIAARGFTLMGRRAIWVALLLAIPLARFGPGYWSAIHGSQSRDTAMDRDSREAAALTRALASSGDTLFVWGYRPELYVYTGMPAATMYLDSQPLTGVPADRHLTQSNPIDWPSAAARRMEVAKSRPSFVLDGLSLFNPRLAIDRYPELQTWFTQYREVARSGQTVIYELRSR
jgi:hypothetical protein